MSRKNEAVEGIFTKLHNSYYDVSERKLSYSSKDTRDLEDLYDHLLDENFNGFLQLAKVEQLLLQRRVYDQPLNIKLGIQDEYIFAMCPFYRGDKKANDIRVYPGKISVLGSDLDVLYSNPEFMDRTVKMLKQQMLISIDRSAEELKQLQ